VSTSRRWNNLDGQIRNLGSLNQFKTALKRLHGYKIKKLYLTGLPQTHVYHTRLRLGLSGLFGHLHSYHIIADGTCQYCYLGIEDTNHYVLRCPYFNIQRITLLASIVEIIPFDILSILNENAIIFCMALNSCLFWKTKLYFIYFKYSSRQHIVLLNLTIRHVYEKGLFSQPVNFIKYFSIGLIWQ